MLGREERQMRTFSKSFKREKVKELEEKRITVSELSRIYEVTNSAIYKWIKLYGTLKSKGELMVIEKETESKRTKFLLEKVKDLEQIVDQKQVEIEYLKRILETEKERTGVDLKKNIKLQ